MAAIIGDRASIEQRRRVAAEQAQRQPVRRRHRRRRRGISELFGREERLGPPPATYYALGVVALTGVLLGLVMLLSASGPARVVRDSNPYSMVLMQALWALFGLAIAAVVLTVPYRTWRSGSSFLAVVGFVLMLLPFTPGLGKEVNDARSWIDIGGFSFQPSEPMKLILIVLVAAMLDRRHKEANNFRRTVLPLIIVFVVTGVLLLLQGDFGSLLVILAVLAAMAFMAGVPLMHLLVPIVGAGAFFWLLVLTSPRRMGRFTAFLDIEGNKDLLSYQPWQGLLSIANGGLFGSGIGGSISKLGYLPLAHSDFIFAVIADELGLVGVVAVLGVFALFCWCGVQASLAAPDRFGMLLAGGISAWFGVQAMVNIGGVVGRLPVTGLTLPFFSHGGTSMAVSIIAAGLLMNVARRGVGER